MKKQHSIEKMHRLEKIFGGNAQTTTLECLLKNRGKITYLSGIAEESGLSHCDRAPFGERDREGDRYKQADENLRIE